MLALGIDQFHKKKFKYLAFEGVWKKFIGHLITGSFVGIIYGQSGQGKSYFAIRFAKYLCKFGRVAWLSYEQKHDPDLQAATKRYKMEEQKGIFIPINPLAKRKAGMTLFEELCEYLSKKSTPEFVFIDSLDYLLATGALTLEQYFFIKENYGKKRGIIFLSHEDKNLPESKIGKKIMYDGQFAIRVFRHTARMVKNRVGGTGNFCGWFREARRADPMFWKKVEAGLEIIHNHADEKAEQEMELEEAKAEEVVNA